MERRKIREVLPAVRRMVRIPLEQSQTPADFVTFDNLPDGKEHFAIRIAGRQPRTPVLVRVHSECITGDVFGSLRCDCGPQLREAIERMCEEGGILVYLRQEGRGIGLTAKLDAYALQSEGLDTFAANRALGYADDMRDFSVAGAALMAMEAGRIRLLTNNPQKAEQIRAAGVDITEIIPTATYMNDINEPYIRAKQVQAGHLFGALRPAAVQQQIRPLPIPE